MFPDNTLAIGIIQSINESNITHSAMTIAPQNPIIIFKNTMIFLLITIVNISDDIIDVNA